MNQANSFYCQPTNYDSSVFLAHRLNDRGAKLLGRGNCEEAITTLVQALKLWEQVADDETCMCKSCSLEECIISTLPKSSSLQQHPAMKSTAFSQSSEESYGEVESEDRFIYKRPIYSSPKFAQRGHSPGITLSLIIILNLAMAHHLSAIQHNHCRKRLQKALQLYELAHQLQMEEEIYSPRATMIIANNVGEIHRAVNNHNKHAMCLQHLLSTMMYMIDCRIPVSSVELEGFFRNTSQLILHNNCASAA
jgi:hypothetical protein